MVKSVLAVQHSGLRSWVVQRVTAVILAVVCVASTVYFYDHPHLSFLEWRTLFMPLWVRVLTLLCMISITTHAWVGIWTVVTDYVKIPGLRFIIHILVFLILLLCVLWTLLMMWSI
jgi:succinate dehydrogenase / fumarate reductase membrane anchor subunit